jgi:alkylated DNA repair dioxygenase AlkB
MVPDFVSRAEEDKFLRDIDAAPWRRDLKRRVQHYGYRYDYKARAVTRQDRLGELPAWAQPLGERLVCYQYFDRQPDQVIVNEYLPGQRINSHTDRVTCFGAVVASVSLGSDVVMDFAGERGETGSLLLPRGRLLVLGGAARTNWRHAIAQRRRDRINSVSFERKRRVSLTFRSVLLSG